MSDFNVRNYGFLRVAAAVPSLVVADCTFNAEAILRLILRAEREGAKVAVFPELCVTSYTCGDLFLQRQLLDSAERALASILEATRGTSVLAALGMPVRNDGKLYNCAVAINRGKILGVVPKSFVPGYKEFYEQRWFASGRETGSDRAQLLGEYVPFGTDLLFAAENVPEVCVGIEICEDLWVPVTPGSRMALAGATVLLNLSASNDIVGKYEYRRRLVTDSSSKCVAAYVYTSSGIDESSTDLVFGGHAVVSDFGVILAESERFSLEEQLVVSDVDVQRLLSERFSATTFMPGVPSAEYRKIEFGLEGTFVPPLRRSYAPHPFVPDDPSSREERCAEIFSIQTSALAKRLRHTGLKRAVLGISGGLDSTLALLVTVKTFDLLKLPREGVIAVTMPGFGTTDRTYRNAQGLMRSMGVGAMEIPVRDASLLHFKDIGHDPLVHDLTYENVQARERTQILMDLANKHGGLVIGTGDLSELALGFATYNGDHMSMYAVNCGVPKTLVRYLVRWVADNMVSDESRKILLDILDTPMSPELLPSEAGDEIRQKTEEIVGPYELHDFFLYHFVRYGARPGKILFLARNAFGDRYAPEVVKKWLALFLKRFFSQQFKRSCVPDGPKVGTVSLSPRGDWRMPSDASARIWLDDLENVSSEDKNP